MAELDLTKLREEIDKIDRELTELYYKRTEVAENIARYKMSANKPVYDPIREREKLDRIIEGAKDGCESDLRQLYSLLFELSKDKQRRLMGRKTDLYAKITEAIESTPKMLPDSPRVACQGVAGAYSMAAADRLFKSPRIEYVKTFDAVVRAVESGYVQYGVLPIENSTAGGVGDVYRILESANVYVVREVRLKIDHNLLALPGVKLADIREIISHEQAINQSKIFLDSLKDVKITYAANTATAAKYVAESGRRDIASISSRVAGEIYGLEAVASDIQSSDNNHTRFVCISKNLEIYPGSDKTMVTLTTGNTPGALYRVISRFNSLGINLSSLVSRTIPGRDFESRFFLSFDTPVYSEEFATLMETIEELCDDFSYLGTYREII